MISERYTLSTLKKKGEGRILLSIAQFLTILLLEGCLQGDLFKTKVTQIIVIAKEKPCTVTSVGFKPAAISLAQAPAQAPEFLASKLTNGQPRNAISTF